MKRKVATFTPLEVSKATRKRYGVSSGGGQIK